MRREVVCIWFMNAHRPSPIRKGINRGFKYRAPIHILIIAERLYCKKNESLKGVNVQWDDEEYYVILSSDQKQLGSDDTYFQRFRVGVCMTTSCVRTLQIVLCFLGFHYSHQRLLDPASVLACTGHHFCYRCISLIILGLLNKQQNNAHRFNGT